MISAIKVFWIYLKSIFIDEKKVAAKLNDSAFFGFPYPIEKLYDKGVNRVYTFRMYNGWIIMGSLKDGQMKLLMHNGKEEANRTLSISEWNNKNTLFGVINSMQVSLKGKVK